MKTIWRKIEASAFVKMIRDGLRMLIPVLTVGSFALILRSLPIDAYQVFINKFASGSLYNVFSIVYNATFGMLSVYMVISLSYCATRFGRDPSGTVIGAISSGLTAFFISVGFLTPSFEINALSPVGMFTAIICGIVAPQLYLFFSRRIPAVRLFSDGSEPTFNNAIKSLLPLTIVAVFFALINYAIDELFQVNNSFELLSIATNHLFRITGRGFVSGLLYILLSSVMWFFGIHGSDVLESVNITIFEPAIAINAAHVFQGLAPTEIFTKTFFDVFVLMGGCGSALSLLIAILLFSRRRSSRSVARMAAFPMLFNINELMIFGLPVAYNIVLLIPFIAVPITMFLISSAAMVFGLVPLTIHEVAWTTPVILGGYQATGSLAGSVLQLVNLSIGVLIYMPFVKRYDKMRETEAKAHIDELVALHKENEALNRNVRLTDEKGSNGDVAKQLVNDLKSALARKELFLMYQPQSDPAGTCVGAEALLRWKHPVFGLIYPPLVIELAEESGILEEVERNVFLIAKSDMEKSGFDRHISVNVTSESLKSKGFIDFLLTTFPVARAGKAPICVEITEQRALLTNASVMETLCLLREKGFRLSIDDFSMGFTSLKYLQDGKFDEVKLDGSLVQSVTDSQRTRDIIASIVYLASSLKFSVVAEFVETRVQQKQLQQLGCLTYQGYLFSKPLPIEELTTARIMHGFEPESPA